MSILDQYGKPIVSQDPRAELQRLRTQITRIKSRYDSSRTYEQNSLHWANADLLSPDSANSYDVRQKLRSRSRYELVENNSYLKGMVLTHANDIVMTGPRLRVTDPRLTKERAAMIEQRFHAWCRTVKLRQKLWQMAMAKVIDGETFAIEIYNPKLAGDIKLDYKIVEADHCTTWGGATWRSGSVPNPLSSEVDGIEFDRYGNPSRYFFLKDHPGSTHFMSNTGEGSWVRASMVLHWFRKDRPWQRGIPELTPSLPLCALLRRYTLAVVQAAEVAADFAGVLESQGPPNGNIWSSNIEDDPFDSFPVDKGLFTTLPWGYHLKQLEAEQPTAVYDKFVDSLLREIARPLLMPFNMAVGFSGGYNFASGTLDRQLYQNAVKFVRTGSEEEILSPMFGSWWFEASRLPDVLGSSSKDIPMHEWRWDWMPDHADPLKSAQSLMTLWDYGFITDDQIQTERFNRDLQEHYRAAEIQRDERERVGLPQPASLGNAIPEATEEPDGSNPGE